MRESLTRALTFAICNRFRYPIPDPELDGVSGNSAEFRPILESLELIPDPELLTDIHSHPHPRICYMQPIPLSDSGSGIGRH